MPVTLTLTDEQRGFLYLVLKNHNEYEIGGQLEDFNEREASGELTSDDREERVEVENDRTMLVSIVDLLMGE